MLVYSYVQFMFNSLAEKKWFEFVPIPAKAPGVADDVDDVHRAEERQPGQELAQDAEYQIRQAGNKHCQANQSGIARIVAVVAGQQGQE